MTQKICVVGAGVTGLVAIRELRDAGHEVRAFERTNDVVGRWNDVYETVQLLTSRRATSFRDFPMPDTYPQFPSGEDYRSYIRAFADWAGLREHISFGTEVVMARPIDNGSGGWDVELGDGTTEHFDALVAAHGHLFDPRIPVYPGEFTGTQLHTSGYRSPSDMDGERILVVGSGNSACDMVTDAIATGRRPLMSLRRGTWFVPQSFYGTPRGDLAFFGDMPPGQGDALSAAFVNVSVGHPTSYGFPAPESDDWRALPPTFSTLIPYWAQRGRVTAVPEIERFDGATVRFVDGTQHEIDTIIWATGYNAPVPFVPEGLVTMIDGIPARKAGGMLSADADNFYYSGMCSPRGGAPHNYGRGAVTIAKLVEARERAGEPLNDTVFAQDQPSGRMDYLLADWVRLLEEIEGRLDRVSQVAPVGA